MNDKELLFYIFKTIVTSASQLDHYYFRELDNNTKYLERDCLWTACGLLERAELMHENRIDGFHITSLGKLIYNHHLNVDKFYKLAKNLDKFYDRWA